MPRLVIMLCAALSAAPLPVLAQSAPKPAITRVAATSPYFHAVQMEARREAFWRQHRIHDRRDITPETAQRQQNYWVAQGRGRAMCSAFGGCS